MADVRGVRVRIERRRREVRRRRAVLGLSVLAIVVGLVVILRAGGSGGGEPGAGDGPPAKATVSTSGDILIHSPVWYRAIENGGGAYDFAPMFSAIEPFVRDVDLSICQMETPLTSGEPSGYPLFATPLEVAADIEEAGWEACSTASNHTLDRGEEGVVETIETLRGEGIETTGSAVEPEDATKPLVLDAGRIKVGLVAYTDYNNTGTPPDESTLNLLPYDAPIGEKKRRVERDVARTLKAGADTVLVIIQWGTENATEPNDSQRELAEAVTRIPGVAAISGQGPHVVQPIERINGKFVVFSAGNLLSNQSAAAGLPAETQYGLIALFRFRSDGGETEVAAVDYVPIWVRPGDYLVEPVGWGLKNDPANAAYLQAAWESTVSIAGQGQGIRPIPAEL